MWKWLRQALGWLWNNLGNIAMVGGWLVTGAVGAWAAKATAALQPWAPFSWVAAGVFTLLLVALGYWLLSAARKRWVRANYDQQMLAKGGVIDPLGKTFERKRIHLSEFVLPSHPIVSGKTFIGCEIIGPANILLVSGNDLKDSKLPHCDAVLVSPGVMPINVYAFADCTFRNCSFQRVTFFISHDEFDMANNAGWLRWVCDVSGQAQLPLNLPAEAVPILAPPAPPGTV